MTQILSRQVWVQLNILSEFRGPPLNELQSMVDNFIIYQQVKSHSVFLGIGEEPSTTDAEVDEINPIRQAMAYRQLMDGGRFNTQAELAHALGVSRSRVASMLRLLKLDEQIRDFLLGLDERDELLSKLTERRLRPLIGLDVGEQRNRLEKWLAAVSSLI